MGKYFTLVLVLVLCSKLLIAQENYTNHSIKKGESVYMISKQYSVSVNAIFELNPGSENVIYAGRTLRIPKSNTSNTSSSDSNNTVISDNKISNYEVKRGETKSGLSRRFGVSIAMLEQQNPQIVRMLQAGHIINVDKSIKEEARVAQQGQHIVVKGETLWGISRKNGINVAQLTAANSNRLSEFLQIGQTLIIPDKNAEITNSGEYLVKRGDTKYELAKRFNMSIAQLEAKNPHILDLLMAGHKLDIDNSTVANVQEETPNNNSENSDSEVDYRDYVIQPKETLFGLSRKAGMTIDEFTGLNPKLLTAVNKGDVIKMPYDLVNSENSNNYTLTSSANENTALFSNMDINTVNGLYFYTPFSGEELSSPEKRQTILDTNKEYQKYIDFFQGAQIAIDSAKSLNLNFDVTLIKKNIAKSQINIESAHAKNALLVPFLENSSNYPNIISNETVSIIDIESNISSNLENRIYKSIASNNLQKTSTLNYLIKQNYNVIVVSELEKSRNKDLILNTIPDAKYLKVDNAGFFESNALQDELSQEKINYIVLDSEKTIVFLNSTTALMSKLSNYNIQLVLLESALLPKQSEVSDMRYRVLKLIFPSITNPNNTNRVSKFEIDYKSIFDEKPSRHSVLGFDVTLDILLRLSQNAPFEDAIDTIVSEHSSLKFDYQKTSDSNYSNTGIYLMQYNSDEGIIELKQ